MRVFGATWPSFCWLPQSSHHEPSCRRHSKRAWLRGGKAWRVALDVNLFPAGTQWDFPKSASKWFQDGIPWPLERGKPSL